MVFEILNVRAVVGVPPSMLAKSRQNFMKIISSTLSLFSIFALVGWVGSANGTVLRTYYANDYNILSGTYISGSFPASIQTVDSDYFVIESSPSATSSSIYNPAAYNLLGSTTYVSGTTDDLVSEDGAYMVYRSYPSATSAQTLYAHQETITLGGNSYYLQKPQGSEATGTTLSASMASTGRQLLGKFVYPLTGVNSIPTSTWTIFYRAWRDPNPGIAFDAVGSGNNGDGAENITWTHVVGSGTNRFMIIGISIKDVTISVVNVTVGTKSATFLRSDVRDTEIKAEVWYLVNPDPGSQTVVVTLSGISRACGGSISYTGVEQTSPIEAHAGVPYGGETPSVSLTTTVDNCWIFSNLAISGTATADSHNSGQVHRYYEIGTGAGPQLAGDDGDDKTTSVAGSYTVSWNMSWWADVVAQAVAFKPAPSPVGHVDVDVLIRQSNGTVRATISTNVADSADLTSTPATLSGTYEWPAYSVVEQSDYLEVDYYIEVTTSLPGVNAYLTIDDSSLPIANQTRITNIILPSEYTTEVEFTGTSNTYDWAQLVWTVESAWNIEAVRVTIQLYNYTMGSYPTSGEGFISYTSSATANVDETKTQTINTNPQHFRDATGNWKVKVKGVKNTTIQFDFKAERILCEPSHWSEYTASTEFLFSSMTTNTPTQLNFTIVSQFNLPNVEVTIQVWNYSASAYATSGSAYLKYISTDTNETKLLSISNNPQFYTSNGNAKIKITGVLSTTIQYQQEINQVMLLYVHEGTNSPPVLDLIGDKNVNELSLLTFNVTASDPDGDPLTFSFGSSVPSGAYISEDGSFAWTPTEAQGPGNYTIRIIVSDANLIDYEDITITVSEVNSAPVLNPIGPKSVDELELLSFNVTARDPDIPIQTLTFSLSVNPPSGASITETGLFTWIPTEAQGPGNYTIRVVVSDGFLSDYEDVSIKVNEIHTHDIAIINVTASPTEVISGQLISISVIVRNQGNVTDTFNVTLFYDDNPIETKTVTNLAPGEQRVLEFTWNTTGVKEASYSIRAKAHAIAGEIDLDNNIYEGTVIEVNAQSSFQSFDWVKTLSYLLPLILALLLLMILKPKIKKKIRLKSAEKRAFSEQFGMSHKQMIGKKMLLEIDPTSDYDKLLLSFVSESKNHDELVFILTNKNSTLHSTFSQDRTIRFLLLTSKISSPHEIGYRKTLLPASDLSVILEAFTRIQKVESKKNINLLIDNLSDIILRCGFEKTYKFIRFLLEAISSTRITALFLFNPMAHETAVASSIRALFKVRLAYTKSGAKIGTL
jgi:hypothetical protein